MFQFDRLACYINGVVFRYAAILLAIVISACAPPPTAFSVRDARTHVNMLAGTIGSRPIGSEANDHARDYIVDRLRSYGFITRVQQVDAERPEFGVTAHVSNIIATKRGTRPDAIALVSHYDSVPAGPGAGDNASGVAVAMEVGHALAGRRLEHTLMLLVTDGEENGLMGAAGVVMEPAVRDRVRAFVNVDAIGADVPSILFEAGPANDWIVDAWADSAPAPRGSSYATEIYERLPNDTDFSILKRLGAPGLNFAIIGDSFAYHTARDTADRLQDRALAHSGSNVLAVIEALDRLDLSKRTDGTATYFDVGGRAAVSYGVGTRRLITLAAILLAIIAGIRAIVASIRLFGGRTLVFSAIWTIVGAIVTVASMIGLAWGFREFREAFHPWYAHPMPFFAALLLVAALVAWFFSRAVGFVPLRGRGTASPVMIWCITLPVWTGIAALAELKFPAASYLWTVPLLVTATLVAITPLANATATKLVSIVSLAVVGSLWLPQLAQLFPFVVAMFGRLPIVTPIVAYPALLAVASLMIAPPLMAILHDSVGPSRRGRAFVTGVLLLVLSGAIAIAYRSPAYTSERPLRRQVRYLHDGATGQAVWEIGGNEPGLDIGNAGSAFGWHPAGSAQAVDSLFPRISAPFVFRAPAQAQTVPPISATAVVSNQGNEIRLDLQVRPLERGIRLTFVAPPGIKPLRSSIAGTQATEWRATYIAPAPEGITITAAFNHDDAGALSKGVLLVRTAALPGGSGSQRLPSWLPQDTTVWDAGAVYLIPLSTLLQNE